MADQNQDGKGMISSGAQPGPGERLRDDAPQAAGSPGITGSQTSAAGGSGGGTASDLGIGASSGGSTYSSGGSTYASGGIRQTGSRVADNARQYAGDIASKAKEKSRSMFDQQKETAIGQVSTVASAIRSTADNLQGEGQDQVARYVGMLADQIETFGGRLREKDLDTLIDDAQNLARRSPATFFIGSVAAGFLLARFLKSSSESQQGYMSMQDDEWSSASSGAGSLSGTGSGGGAGTGMGVSGTTGTTGTTGTGTYGTATRQGVSDGTAAATGLGSSATPANGAGAGGSSI
ncbi:MAG TPA: hypothetical protein VIM12_12145 [Noviherbaspirillum sp.]|uniref:hypothetical protein n=1 Tax=Noviherbaspirillum sp. TaxID=1926288 RepID=UPI002F93AAD4